MAKSSGAKGFIPVRNIEGPDIPTAFEFIIDNSETVTIGDAVDFNSGYLQVVDAGDNPLGVVVGIVDANGVPVNHPDADVDGTVTGDDTYATASDNTSDKKVKAQVIISTNVLYFNDADSDLSAAKVGLYFDTTATGDQITGSGSTSAGAFQLVVWEPNNDGDASTGLFKISETQLFTYAQP